MSAVRPRGWLGWCLAVFAFLVLASSSVDLLLARKLYSAEEGWHLGDGRVASALYDYGPFVAVAMALTGLLALALQRWVPAARRERALALVLVLTYLVGPGLIVNTALKPAVGRSRPRNLVEFGGGHGDYEPVFSLDHHGSGTSFPSGHASAGFYLMTPYFPLRRRRPRAARAWLACGLAFGLVMGITRMLQGGHFLSDVVAAGLITAATGAAVTWLVERRAGRSA